jgi:hypothetical protein
MHPLGLLSQVPIYKETTPWRRRPWLHEQEMHAPWEGTPDCILFKSSRRSVLHSPTLGRRSIPSQWNEQCACRLVWAARVLSPAVVNVDFGYGSLYIPLANRGALLYQSFVYRSQTSVPAGNTSCKWQSLRYQSLVSARIATGRSVSHLF